MYSYTHVPIDGDTPKQNTKAYFYYKNWLIHILS